MIFILLLFLVFPLLHFFYGGLTYKKIGFVGASIAAMIGLSYLSETFSHDFKKNSDTILFAATALVSIQGFYFSTRVKRSKPSSNDSLDSDSF